MNAKRLAAALREIAEALEEEAPAPPTPTTPPADVLDSKGAAELLNMTEITVRRKANKGELPGTRPGGNEWRFLRSDLMTWLAADRRKKEKAA